MFNFFKQKKAEKNDKILHPFGPADVELAKFLKAFLTDVGRESWMVLVALEVLEVTTKMVSDSKTTDSKVPRTVDGYISVFNEARKNESKYDEFQQRRIYWLLSAAQVKRVTLLSENNKIIRDDVAQIWILLAKGGSFIYEDLDRIELWDEIEKMFFSHIKTPNDGIEYCLNIMLPKHLRSHAAIGQFANTCNVYLLNDN
ncbi:hypothetical protein EV681_4595 [Advenella incenata]|uniref:Uncharacterized protein n=1 Tax=Advenella incenata TaxID=267800 RepID=A0A4Q7V8T6_9BURK|nr:hypothetical protein [Advenella incenata]RZT91072.1 hypothetical protein EV681_4595 [Advenella incenata]